jgi:hypothetical protein
MQNSSQTTKPTSQSPSHTKDLLLLFSIPVGIALLAAAVTYLPSHLAHPAYSFIYAYCDDYACKNSYSLDSTDHVIQNVPPATSYDPYTRTARLVYFDTASGATRTLTYDEARHYDLINSSKSPDGYTLEHNTGSSGFLFWDDSKNDWELKNGAKKLTVQLSSTQDSYSDNVTFLGWVKK